MRVYIEAACRKLTLLMVKHDLASLLALLVLVGACASTSSRGHAETHVAVPTLTSTAQSAPSPPAASAATKAADPAAPTPIPHVEPGEHELAVPGFEPAVIVVPGAARPLLVAAHGAGGDARWECERWQRVARGRWFLLCPRGAPLNKGDTESSFYRDHHALEHEVMAALDAARTAYGPLLLASDGVYVGYSQGATMGALMLVDHGSDFPHLLLIEGGSGDWTLARAERFHETGGQSVLIVCGTPACAERAARARPVLERAGLRAAAARVTGGGHTELGAVGDQAETLLETLVSFERAPPKLSKWRSPFVGPAVVVGLPEGDPEVVMRSHPATLVVIEYGASWPRWLHRRTPAISLSSRSTTKACRPISSRRWQAASHASIKLPGRWDEVVQVANGRSDPDSIAARSVLARGLLAHLKSAGGRHLTLCVSEALGRRATHELTALAAALESVALASDLSLSVRVGEDTPVYSRPAPSRPIAATG